jgi:uncharacterized protein YbjT (DUF2867 family)
MATATLLLCLNETRTGGVRAEWPCRSNLVGEERTGLAHPTRFTPAPAHPASSGGAGPEKAGRTVLLAGASGLVGREILQRLLADESVAAVHALVRRDLELRHPRLTWHRVDFTALPALPRVDEAFIALGTTIKAAGSQAAFRAVDFDAVLAVANAAIAAGATRLGVVSAMGADAHSSVFYSRVKGETEEALSALGFETLVIARPSLLAGDREALGQPVRAGEKIGLKLSRWLSPLIPAHYKPIPAEAVAAGLIRAVRETRGRRIVPSGELQR